MCTQIVIRCLNVVDHCGAENLEAGKGFIQILVSLDLFVTAAGLGVHDTIDGGSNALEARYRRASASASCNPQTPSARRSNLFSKSEAPTALLG